MKNLKDLVLSLVNATVMLLIILVLLSLVLVSRLDGLTENARAAAQVVIAPQAERLDQIGKNIAELKVKLEVGNLDDARIAKLMEQLKALNDQIAAARVQIGKAQSVPFDKVVSRLRKEIAELIKGSDKTQ